MAEKKPLVMIDGSRKELPATDSIPLANMPRGGLLPLTSSYRIPVGCEPVYVDRVTGVLYRLFMANGIWDQETVVNAFKLLMEDGGALLNEDGTYLLLEA